MKLSKIEFRYAGAMATLKWTSKARRFKEISIKGTRWTDVHSNVYHKAYISGLNQNGIWEEIGETGIHAGYGMQYVLTGGEWLINNGYLAESVKTNGYCLSSYVVRDNLRIKVYEHDVKRKSDM